MHAATGWFIALSLLSIAAYDLFVWWRYGVEWTISYWVRVAGEHWPLLQPTLAFVAGLLYGHFFLGASQ